MTGCPFLHDAPTEPDVGPAAASETCLHVLTSFYRALDAGDTPLAMMALDDHVHFVDGLGEWSGRRTVESRLRSISKGRTDIIVTSVSEPGRSITMVAEVERHPQAGSTDAATRVRVRHGFRLSQGGWRLVSCVPETVAISGS